MSKLREIKTAVNRKQNTLDKMEDLFCNELLLNAPSKHYEAIYSKFKELELAINDYTKYLRSEIKLIEKQII